MIGDGKLEIRIFRSEDMTNVLQLANMYAAFDGTTSEVDLVVSRFFPNGFWVPKKMAKWSDLPLAISRMFRVKS